MTKRPKPVLGPEKYNCGGCAGCTRRGLTTRMQWVDWHSEAANRRVLLGMFAVVVAVAFLVCWGVTQQ